ncbi:DUF6525 family protein [Roseomonas sp. NAR14]|uniref:DUF6525 family protein n=1 Tax=Roseomonas acroporae TaxID=2937791 RepID=A0A9X2BUL5_9PROT|nr:DUF6525 family protein [Roseomonas acroporae]MCK8785773.1 DUF6525 family protein [Roseomonas acroporae]
MDNSMAARPYSRLKGDPYRAYEELPVEVRLALQEALVDWCPLRTREWYLQLLHRRGMRPAQAAFLLVQTIRRYDHAEVAAFARTLSKGADAYPHLAAGATLQRYVGTDGIPAPEPLPAAPAATRPRVAEARPKVRAARPKARATRPKARTKRQAGRRSRR